MQEEAPEIPDLFLRLHEQANQKQIIKDKILKDIRTVRRGLYRETYGDDQASPGYKFSGLKLKSSRRRQKK
ncbi:MAG: hypothetical protein QSU88_08195, partial [Candidatus Methanoperedens sp.]|nr:hypothetical protein [Candidatus Methanoperedens sp.]